MDLKEELSVEPYDLNYWSCDDFRITPSPFPYLVENLIPLGTSGTIYSAGTVGKTLLALDLCVRFHV